MDKNHQKIAEQYFQEKQKCRKLACQICIFEPGNKKEWFFEDEKWCCFEFFCEDKDYRLIKKDEKVFGGDCVIRKMSYEIVMLSSFCQFRNVVTIDKEDFSRYILRYEKEKKNSPELTLEQFNFAIKLKEEDELNKSDKITNRILTGCLGMILIMLILFVIAAISFFTASPASASSKYSKEFVESFAFCKMFKESKYNPAYNSKSTYEINGYKPDGTCEYVETNEWLKGKNITTCHFSYAQVQEYSRAMMFPNEKHSSDVNGMAVVGGHEEVVFLKYFNMPSVCKTIAQK